MKNPFSLFRKSKVDTSVNPSFDLHRYLGSWYEIARFDHWFEHGLTHATAEYILQDNNNIKVVNQGLNAKSGKMQEAIGRAKVTNKPRVLRVSFFWRFYSDYRILSIGEDYDWALVTSGRSGKYLWILSRNETLPETTLQTILEEAKRRNFDISRLIYN